MGGYVTLDTKVIYQMPGYYLCVMRKTGSKSSVYFNQICSDIYTDKDRCIKDAKHRIAKKCATQVLALTEQEWTNLPVNTLFFYIQEIEIIATPTTNTL
jgi:hypothetical protein